MIMCRQVSKALAEHHYWELPWYRRIPMFIHIRLCVMCGKYNRQIVDMQKGVHQFLQHEETGDFATSTHLSDEAKQKIRGRLKQEQEGYE